MTIAFVLGIFLAFYGALGMILWHAIRTDKKRLVKK